MEGASNEKGTECTKYESKTIGGEEKMSKTGNAQKNRKKSNEMSETTKMIKNLVETDRKRDENTMIKCRQKCKAKLKQKTHGLSHTMKMTREIG